jgi:hypothetical protein
MVTTNSATDIAIQMDVMMFPWRSQVAMATIRRRSGTLMARVPPVVAFNGGAARQNPPEAGRAQGKARNLNYITGIYRASACQDQVRNSGGKSCRGMSQIAMM